MGIYLIIALMAVGVSVSILRPLRSAKVETTDRSEHEIEIYKDQLAENSRDLDRGLIQRDEAKAVELEISRKIIKSNEIRKDTSIWTKKDKPYTIF